MTTEQFRRMLNEDYALDEWPAKLLVDHETYANVCNDIIHHLVENIGLFMDWDIICDGIQLKDERRVSIAIGPNNGIMFKNIELILK